MKKLRRTMAMLLSLLMIGMFMGCAGKESDPIEVMEAAQQKNSQLTSSDLTMTMDMDLPEIMQMTMGMDGTYQSSRTAPDAQPPAGAEVVDLMELMIGEVEPAPEPAAEA